MTLPQPEPETAVGAAGWGQLPMADVNVLGPNYLLDIQEESSWMHWPGAQRPVAEFL